MANHGPSIAKFSIFCPRTLFGINIYSRLFIKTTRHKIDQGDEVDTNRRDALKLGASAAVGSMFISSAIAAPGDSQKIVVEPLTGKAGFRVANYVPKMGASSRLGLVTNDGFVVDIPATPMDPSTALPVQIYLWASSPERAFVERTSAGIIVLLLFLAVMNSTAVYLRKKFERRW